MIKYYAASEITLSISDTCLYFIVDGAKFKNTGVQGKRFLMGFDLINGADLSASVTTVYGMFMNCTSLITVPLVDTGKVTIMDYMFFNAVNLRSVPRFDTAKVTTMDSMFRACVSLAAVPLFDTRNVSRMPYLYFGCASLKEVPLLDTAKVTDMGHMHEGCISLSDIPDYDLKSVTVMTYYCNGCTSLVHHPYIYADKVADKNSMFRDCKSLKYSSVNMEATTNAYAMYNGCASILGIVLRNTESLENIEYICRDCAALNSIVFEDVGKVQLTTNAFLTCTNLCSARMDGLAVSLTATGTYLSRDCMRRIIAQYADLTGKPAQTLTFGAANLAKLSAVEKAIASGKNVTLA